MKYIIYFFLSLSLVTARADDLTVLVRKTDKNVYDWLVHAECFSATVYGFTPKSFYLLKRNGEDKIRLLYGNFPLISATLSDSMISGDGKTVISDRDILRFTLDSMLPSGKAILDARFLEKCKFFTTNKFQGVYLSEKILKLVEPLCVGPKIEREGGVWTFSVNILSQDGAIQRCELEGTDAPLSIRKFSTEILHPVGTFKPLNFLD